MSKGRKKEKKKAKKVMPPSSYITMPHYFPIDIVKKIKPKKRRKQGRKGVREI